MFNMQNLLDKLLDLMGVDHAVITYSDGETAELTLPLGLIPGGTYVNGLWGSVELLDTDAVLNFTCGDLYGEGEFVFGEGTVNLNYAPHNEGLAYGNELEDLIAARVKQLYNLDVGGSEQGMQGDNYLSLDIHNSVGVQCATV